MANRNRVRINKVIYLLITFFLGSLGIHKFYAGKIGAGLLYLIFSFTGIPTLIAIYDFIVALIQAPDRYGNILV